MRSDWFTVVCSGSGWLSRLVLMVCHGFCLYFLHISETLTLIGRSVWRSCNRCGCFYEFLQDNNYWLWSPWLSIWWFFNAGASNTGETGLQIFLSMSILVVNSCSPFSFFLSSYCLISSTDWLPQQKSEPWVAPPLPHPSPPQPDPVSVSSFSNPSRNPVTLFKKKTWQFLEILEGMQFSQLSINLWVFLVLCFPSHLFWFLSVFD